MTRPHWSLSQKGISPCLRENLCASVVKLLEKTLTTEAQRSPRGTEIDFSDRLHRGCIVVHELMNPPAPTYQSQLPVVGQVSLPGRMPGRQHLCLALCPDPGAHLHLSFGCLFSKPLERGFGGVGQRPKRQAVAEGLVNIRR